MQTICQAATEYSGPRAAEPKSRVCPVSTNGIINDQSDNGLAKGHKEMMLGSSTTVLTSIKLSFMLY